MSLRGPLVVLLVAVGARELTITVWRAFDVALGRAFW